jgi:hypothetical protein
MQNLNNSKSIHNVLRSQYHQHSNGRDITSLEASQTSSRKRNRKTGAANVEATKREQQHDRPPAGSVGSVAAHHSEI